MIHNNKKPQELVNEIPPEKKLLFIKVCYFFFWGGEESPKFAKIK